MSVSSAEFISARDPAASRRAIEALRDGRLIGLPTDTVYGIAALLTRRAALDKLLQLRSRRAGTTGGWVWHMAEAREAQMLLPDLPALAWRLMRKAWPGPVALQVPVTAADLRRLEQTVGRSTAAEMVRDGHITLRCPQNDIARTILAAAGGPVAVVAAGGTHAAEEAADIAPRTLEQLALVVDDGRTRYRHSSTMVRVEADAVQVIREGAIAERIIRKMADHVILFVCTGNTCRSPMAAGIAQKLLAERLGTRPEWLPQRRLFVESAGLGAMTGSSATAEAVQAAAAIGVDIASHRSRPLTDGLLHRADLIYTMTRAHQSEILDRSPAAGPKTFLLDGEGDIADPMGGSLAVYRKVARRMEELLRRRVEEMWP